MLYPWVYTPSFFDNLVMYLRCVNKDNSTTFRKYAVQVPGQFWNSEYPVPKEFYSSSTKIPRNQFTLTPQMLLNKINDKLISRTAA